jgi:hypothetical protein
MLNGNRALEPGPVPEAEEERSSLALATIGW